MSFVEDLILGWFYTYVSTILAVAGYVFGFINDLIIQFFPVLEDVPTIFENFIDSYIVPYINYFIHLLPPNAMNLFILYVGCLLAFYTITIAIHLLVKAFELVKSIKIW